jgi:hypothetical protein
MDNSFETQVKLKTNSELLEIIENKNKYQLEFWEIALQEASNRTLTNDENQKIKITLDEQKKLEETKYLAQIEKDNLPTLYSDKAILLFCILFTPIAGSILFTINLRTIDGARKSIKVILFGIIYTALTILIIFITPKSSIRPLGFFLNILGGFIITIYYGLKFYPKDLRYNNKPIWKPLAFAFLISLILYVPIYFYLN